MEWISVETRLPDLYDYVLVCANNQGSSEPKPISIARISCAGPNEWEFLNEAPLMPTSGAYMDIEYGLDQDEITHWMPLPPPPKEKITPEKECEEIGHMNTWMPKNQTLCMRCGALNEE